MGGGTFLGVALLSPIWRQWPEIQRYRDTYVYRPRGQRCGHVAMWARPMQTCRQTCTPTQKLGPSASRQSGPERRGVQTTTRAVATALHQRYAPRLQPSHSAHRLRLDVASRLLGKGESGALCARFLVVDGAATGACWLQIRWAWSHTAEIIQSGPRAERSSRVAERDATSRPNFWPILSPSFLIHTQTHNSTCVRLPSPPVLCALLPSVVHSRRARSSPTSLSSPRCLPLLSRVRPARLLYVLN